MNSKKYLYIYAIFFLLIYACYSIFVLNYKILYMDREYPMWLHIKEVVNSKIDDNITVLMIGDSRAKAGFIPNEIQKFKSMNLSVGGGTPIEGYYTLEKYLNKNEKPEKLILSYVANHFNGNNSYYTRTVPFEFLEEDDYKEIEKYAKYFNNQTLLSDNYRNYKFPRPYGSNFKNGILNARWIDNGKIFNECFTSKGHHYFGTRDGSSGFNYEAKHSDFQYSKLNDFYFKKILKLANDNNIEILFYIMPYNNTSYKVIKEDFVARYEKYLTGLAAEYNTKVCNKVFSMSDSMFGDPSHLFKGASKNTQLIVNCVLSK